MISTWWLNLFTWNWAINFLLSVLPWYLWWRIVHREHRKKLIIAGAVIAIISLILDVVGVMQGLWKYHVCVIPMNIGLFPYDATLIPVVVTVLIYRFPKIHFVIKAVLFSTLTAFVGHPIFDNWLGFVSHIHWKNSYSIPIYILLYLIAHFVYMEQYKKLS